MNGGHGFLLCHAVVSYANGTPRGRASPAVSAVDGIENGKRFSNVEGGQLPDPPRSGEDVTAAARN
jgi:hypothetical protein